VVLDVLRVGACGLNILRSHWEALQRLGIRRNRMSNELGVCQYGVLIYAFEGTQFTFVFVTQDVTFTLPTSSQSWW
jgi:hypothetical protein